MSVSSSVRFPGESPEYRSARDELLAAELDLRVQVERVAALRRKLPVGGSLREDYVFDEVTSTGLTRVRLSELFAPGKDSLILYSYMYGPKMATPCPLCTSFLDALDGEVPHIVDRVNLAIVTRSPIDRTRTLAAGRGWRNLRLLSSAGNTYNADYHGETADGAQMPTLNVFVRRNGTVNHFYCTETLFTKTGDGLDTRHIDMLWPLWAVFDLTPDGRGSKWYPKLAYGA